MLKLSPGPTQPHRGRRARQCRAHGRRAAREALVAGSRLVVFREQAAMPTPLICGKVLSDVDASTDSPPSSCRCDFPLRGCIKPSKTTLSHVL